MTTIINGSSPSVTFSDSTTQTTAYPSTATFGFKNRIINGGMTIDQRNAGASVATTVTNNITYTLDRWAYWNSTASKYTVQQNAGSITPPAGYINYLGVTSTSPYTVGSSDYFMLYQAIEGLNVADLGWGTANAKTVTLSFQVYSSLTGTFGGTLNNSGASRSYPFTYTISSANTWTSVSITIAGDTSGTWLTTNGVGIQLRIGLGVGSTLSGTAGAWASANYISATGATSVVGTNGATFYITGVQLELGSAATAFDFRDYGRELILCQRYYQIYNNPVPRGTCASATALSRIGMPLEVHMRPAPTLSMSGTLSWFDGSNLGTITAISSGYSTINSIEFDCTAATGSTAASRPITIYINATAGAFIASAEL